MITRLEINDIICPRCGIGMDARSGEEMRCPHCDLKTRVLLFRPLPLLVEHPTPAGPEDAACAHHPANRAVAVCAGTGDYICSLCHVALDGKSYSVQYLEGAGKSILTKSYTHYLPRPDTEIVTLALFTLLVSFLGVIFIPLMILRFFTTRKLRRENPLYARLVGPGRMAWLGIVAFGFGAMAAFGVLAIIVAIVINNS
ncbi:MAG: hypothetical protein IT444_13950 [Phycisphaeraceae bacterium]|nr:hypothetical protein [Phycisphaeraceae bacterium]